MIPNYHELNITKMIFTTKGIDFFNGSSLFNIIVNYVCCIKI